MKNNRRNTDLVHQHIGFPRFGNRYIRSTMLYGDIRLNISSENHDFGFNSFQKINFSKKI